MNKRVIKILLVVLAISAVVVLVLVLTSGDDTDQAANDGLDSGIETEIRGVEWDTVSDAVSGLTFIVNPAWASDVEVSVFNADDQMPLDYGSPVTVSYDATQEEWQEYELGQQRGNANTEVSQNQVGGNLPTAIVRTGDGNLGQVRVLFVSGEMLYEFALPEVLGDLGQSYADDLPMFIEGIEV